ncbi:MAG: MaoC family dehydratase N-terminal domain-containing protein [Chloroflexi bacterium]|nr:MaoC family dehydratase N-terminal domain-containing protein [Chloroflexota bacterium]
MGYTNSTGDPNLTTGRELEEAHFALDSSLVGEYIAVVDDRADVYRGSVLVPPTAIAALGVGKLLERLALPPGAVHLAQELEVHRAARCGERVSCRARVAHSSQRRGGRFLILDFTVADHQGQPILDGRTTLLLPGREG